MLATYKQDFVLNKEVPFFFHSQRPDQPTGLTSMSVSRLE